MPGVPDPRAAGLLAAADLLRVGRRDRAQADVELGMSAAEEGQEGRAGVHALSIAGGVTYVTGGGVDLKGTPAASVPTESWACLLYTSDAADE